MDFKLELTQQEVQILGQALMEVPTKFGMPLLDKIQKQVNDQLPKEEIKQEVIEDESVSIG